MMFACMEYLGRFSLIKRLFPALSFTIRGDQQTFAEVLWRQVFLISKLSQLKLEVCHTEKSLRQPPSKAIKIA